VQRFLPSLWLLAAAFFAGATLLLNHSLYADALLAQAAAHETVRAKEPLLISPEAANRLGLLALPVPNPVRAAREAAAPLAHRKEWVQVSAYTTVVHAQPSASSPVIFAYPIGQQFRVIAREGGFARVQDLGSGQLGWIQESSLTPLIRGYRVREIAPSAPQIADAASSAPQVAMAEPSPPRSETLIRPVKLAAVPALQPSRHAPMMLAPETVPVSESAPEEAGRGGLFKQRGQAQFIAARGRGGELAGLVQRAFSGY
jgi:hypothetical protein